MERRDDWNTRAPCGVSQIEDVGNRERTSERGDGGVVRGLGLGMWTIIRVGRFGVNSGIVDLLSSFGCRRWEVS